MAPWVPNHTGIHCRGSDGLEQDRHEVGTVMARFDRVHRPNDSVSNAVRSRMMAAVRQQDTAPEMSVRAILRSLGATYRINNRDLPGSPDVANRKRKWAVFVNGCYWHGHKRCKKTKGGATFRVPVTNAAFWRDKFIANRKRDASSIKSLRRLGYTVILVWECELLSRQSVIERFRKLISNGRLTIR